MSRIEEALEKVIRRKEPVAPITTSIEEDVSTETFRKHNPHIIGFTLQDAPVAEEYRKLRSMILRLTKKNGNRNAIMVTSTESGEGKSLTAINLALIMAQEFHHTVLLVDADLRRPVIHKYLGLELGIGLVDCLVDGIDVGRALVKTVIPKLTVLPSGRQVNKPVELLSSNKMKNLVAELKHRYHDRYIIIDTPPVLPFAETHILSSIVDETLFVVKEGTAAGDLRTALDILKDHPPLGFVFNNSSMEGTHGRYYHYYQYYNQQRKDTPPDKPDTKNTLGDK